MPLAGVAVDAGPTQLPTAVFRYGVTKPATSSGGVDKGCPVPPMMSTVTAVNVKTDVIVDVRASKTAPTMANKTTANERTTIRIQTLPDEAVMKLGSREPSPDSRSRKHLAPIAPVP